MSRCEAGCLSFDSSENLFELQDKSFEKRIAGDFSWAIQNLDRKTGTQAPSMR
jgi:hypothetical protein